MEAAVMTNVVPFRQPAPPAKPYLLLTTLIDPYSPPERGDLVAFRFDDSQTLLFGYWWGPTGRDGKGRFVKKGSPRETIRLDDLSYTVAHRGPAHVTILGKVLAAKDLGERLTPSPKAS
jgi:hypothetical protein